MDITKYEKEYNAGEGFEELQGDQAQYCKAIVLAQANRWLDAGTSPEVVLERVVRTAAQFVYFHRHKTSSAIVAQGFAELADDYFSVVRKKIPAYYSPAPKEPWKSLLAQPLRFTMADTESERARRGLNAEGLKLLEQGRPIQSVAFGCQFSVMPLVASTRLADPYGFVKWYREVAHTIMEMVLRANEEESALTDDQIVQKVYREFSEAFD